MFSTNKLWNSSTMIFDSPTCVWCCRWAIDSIIKPWARFKCWCRCSTFVNWSSQNGQKQLVAFAMKISPSVVWIVQKRAFKVNSGTKIMKLINLFSGLIKLQHNMNTGCFFLFLYHTGCLIYLPILWKAVALEWHKMSRTRKL